VTRSRRFALASAVAASLVAAACTKEPANGRFAQGGVELKLMIWGTPDEVLTVKHYVQVFRERTPGIEVTIQHAPDLGFREKLNTRFLGGDPPDVFYLSFEDFPGVASRGWLLPIDDRVAHDEKEGTFDHRAFFPEVYDQFRYEGKLFGIVKDFATLVLYYNKDLFDKYDVPHPHPGWTWTEFLDDCHRLTHPAAGGGPGEYGFVMETWAAELLPWIWQAGGEYVVDDPPRWVLGKDPYLERNAHAYQFLADLIWKERVCPSPSVTRDQGTSDFFKTGKVGMCSYGRWKCMEFRNIRDFDWDVAELPKDVRQSTTLFPVCYAIARETPHKDAAWELVKFLTNEETQIAVAESGHAIPSMTRIAQSKHFFEPEALAGLGVDGTPNVSSISFARTPPSLLGWQEVRKRLERAVEALWNGTRRDAREILVELQPEIEPLVAKEPEIREKARVLRGER
jgi:multiple sugar transport system substrate-binding protein